MVEHVVIDTGALLDVVSGALLPDRRILARDGEVVAVLGPDEAVPDGAHILDLRGLTALPGLIDAHTHLIGEMEFAGIPGT